MLFHLRHDITYDYEKPVFLEPMSLRLQPTSCAHQRLVDFQLDITPTPAGLTWTNDIHGNVVALVWFDKLSDALAITAHSEVRTLRDNPFDYLITDPALLELPVPAGHFPSIFAPFLIRPARSPKVDYFVQQLAEQTQGQSVSFLDELTRTLHQQWKLVVRDEGAAMRPEQTLGEKEGACRDLAVLWIDACRTMGLPARFVSGYLLIETDEPEPPQLHGWAEVYLPGAGWRGYDPSMGLAVAARHIRVAAAASPEDTMATEGSYRGTDVACSMRYQIHWSP